MEQVGREDCSSGGSPSSPAKSWMALPNWLSLGDSVYASVKWYRHSHWGLL